VLSTLAIPLDKSWTNSSVEIASTDNPSGFPVINVPNLWWDSKYSKSLYSYGGGTSLIEAAKVDSLSVWEFFPDNNTWIERFGPNDDIWKTMTRASRCGSVVTPDSAFCLGGYYSFFSTDVNPPPYDTPIEGMIQFNFESSTWDNVSSAGASQQNYIINSQVEYIPDYGEEGILVSIGGDSPATQGVYFPGNDPVPMSDITVYDIKNQTWYSQTATGDVPDGRSQFCSIIAKGGDNDSWEMLVHLLFFYLFSHMLRST
jgi:hypothetical protein